MYKKYRLLIVLGTLAVLGVLLFLGVLFGATAANAADFVVPYNASNSYSLKLVVAPDDATLAPAGFACLQRTDVTPVIELGCVAPVAPATSFPGGTTVTVPFTLVLAPATSATINGYVKPPTTIPVGNSLLTVDKAIIGRPQLLVPGRPALLP